ncbi:uncharacterized protein [Antedon mediterranea]|uniref:uncharacterized protein n=1 Tax=Antedon mediterranea TaxID=105859 RepID=UPI003AF85264
MGTQFIIVVNCICLFIILLIMICLRKYVNTEVTSEGQNIVNTAGNVTNGIMGKTTEFKTVIDEILDLLDECCSSENVKDVSTMQKKNDDTGNVNCEFMKDTTEFKFVVDDILNILSYSTALASEFDKCDLCSVEVKADDNYVTCNCCRKNIHVTCVRHNFEDKICDSRVIWICSMCGNSNFADNMLGEIGIPCHFNRYMILEHDSVTDFQVLTKNKETCSETNQQNRRKNNVKSKCHQTGSENLLGGKWIRVRSRKKTNRKTKNRSNKKERKQVINGIIIEPGVKYIGKGVKDFFERRNNKEIKRNKTNNDETNVLDNAQTIVDVCKSECYVSRNTKEINAIQQLSGGGFNSKRLRNNKGRFVKSKKSGNKESQDNVDLNLKRDKNDCDKMDRIGEKISKNVGNNENLEMKTDYKRKCTKDNPNTAVDDVEVQNNSNMYGNSTGFESKCNVTDHESTEFEENEVLKEGLIDEGPNKAPCTSKIRTNNKSETKFDEQSTDVDVKISTTNKSTEVLIIDGGLKKSCNATIMRNTQPIHNLKIYNRNDNYVTVAHGSFNQGHSRFGYARGKQCVANSLVAILYTTKRNGNEFYTKDLDRILHLGNELYCYIQKDSTMDDDFLLISELPKELDILDNTFVVSPKESVFGIIDGNVELMAEYGALSLNEALQQELHQHDACFMNFNRSTFAVIKRVNGFLIFDSHARDRVGCVSEHGKSILLYSTCWEGVYDYCIRLARSMNCNLHETDFELTGVNVQNKSMFLCSSSSVTLDDNCEQNNSESVNVDLPSTSCQFKSSKTLLDSNIDSTFKGHKHSNKQDDISTSNACQNDEDIEIVNIQYGEKPDKNFKFVPILEAEKKNICNKLGINYKHSGRNCSINRASHIGHPLQIKNITGDGNCFYRAISYIISGTENNHLILRKAITNHLLESDDMFSNALSDEYRTVKEYVIKKRVMDNGTWASNTEISAMANLLNTDIYSFNDQLVTWQMFSAQLPGRINEVTTGNGIYILYNRNVHFNVVESVNVNLNYREEAIINKDSNDLYISSKMNVDLATKHNLTKHNNKRKINEISHEELLDVIGPKQKQSKIVEGVCSNNKTLRDSKKTSERNKKHKQKCRMRIKRSNRSMTNVVEKHNKAELQRMKYQNDFVYREEKKRKAKEAQRIKYADDNYKFSKTMGNRERQQKAYKCEPYYNLKIRNKTKQNYKINLDYRSSRKAKSMQKYKLNERFRQNLKETRKNRYHSDLIFRQNFKQYNKKNMAQKYRNNFQFRQHLSQKLAAKYRNNLTFRQNLKQKLGEKYHNNLKFRESCKRRFAEKYHGNTQFCKQKFNKKYHMDPKFKQNCTQRFTKKYHSDLLFRKNVVKKTMKNRKLRKAGKCSFEFVLQNFRETISYGPEYVCCVCFKMLFRNQVVKCTKAKYENRTCINDKYLHICNKNCNKPCQIAKSPRCRLWICFTCHKKLLNGKVPAEANSNNLELLDIPPELKCLNNLEQHLIGLNIPFMKLMNLPKGGQHGIHGPVVCVPSNTIETVKILPRPEAEDQLISVKLKRKLSYKGYYKYKFVNTANVIQALEYLQDHNKWYFDVAIDEKWHNYLSKENIESATTNVDDQETCVENNEEEIEDRLCGIAFDTSLQPVDRRQNLVDEYFRDIICCAPCENNSPIALLTNESNEAKSFPVLFPTGQPTFHDTRDVKITLGRYLHNRLMHVDNRFAKNTEFIFYAQSIYELQQILSSISIALRKGTSKNDFSKVTVSDLKNMNKIEEILKSDKGYKFLKHIRGTPPYWQTTQKDVLAMVRQIGKPTFFLSFSSADLRWKEIMTTLLSQTGDKRNIDDLEWLDKCNLLKSNPVTVARMFDKRFHTFLKNVILSEANPIGKVTDYFYRIEFQMRGSPHVHMLVWVENAPVFDEDEDKKVIDFVDKYISCAVPCQIVDPEMNEIVTSVQIHSKRHSKSCKKKGTNCRFNFPRQPSERTFVMRPTIVDKNSDDNDDGDANKQAQELLTSVKNALANEETYQSAKELFQSLDITQSTYEDANNCITNEEKIVLKRNPQDAWVNQYNPSLLRAWNANMDIQYITSVYACVTYVIGYMSKSEREMGLLLSHAASEVKEGNENARQSLSKLGHVYMNNREVSAQESVYRVCGLKLKECSRKVEFIPVGPNPVRMSLPLSVIKNKFDDHQSAWLPNKLDKYKARPDSFEFNTMCLATFCSNYRMLSTSAMNENVQRKNVFQLKKQLGFIQKRTRTNNAIIRYPRFPINTASEKYFMSILQLFLPFRTEKQLKPPKFQSYQEFYELGSVKLCDSKLQKVNVIVDKNMDKYDKSANDIEHAESVLAKFGPQEDAWGLLCPESEIERLENPKPNVDVDDEEKEFFVPDFGLKKTETSTIEYKVNRKEPEPFHTFITGGAGTGKSHLVNCIYNEATRILGKIMENPDDMSILKLAPTGIAAYNIKGHTIHSALSIPIHISLPYQPLGEEKISALRNQLGQLQIVIIDEISMVNQKLLWYIHGRLRQIKQVRNDSAFGNISIIAVGDFYQLPPVRGTSLYKDKVENALWVDNFKKVQLDEIMRQKEDKEFALLLNKLRTKERHDCLSDKDLSVLKSCETGEQCEDAVHIYPCNKQVNEWNKKMLHKTCSDVICIEAEDTVVNSKKQNKKCDKPRKSRQSNLLDYLWIALNARVMLIKNVDVKKGLTNGCMGHVEEIIKPSQNAKPVSIKVKFDNNDIGIQAIEMFQESIGKKYSRKQFPLKLAYACTVHKVQGMTMNKALVCLKNTFAPGQAYVALSRVTSISGLTIEHVNPNLIYCDPNIKEYLNKMNSYIQCEKAVNGSGSKFSIMLHNIQGLKHHFADLQCNDLFMNSSIICLTETWLNKDDDFLNLSIEPYKLYHQERYDSYSDKNNLTLKLKNQAHGGVAVYTKNTFSSRLDIGIKDIEVISFLITCPISIAVSVIYRPPSYDIKQFCQNLKKLLQHLHKVSTKCIIMGDFNENLFKQPSRVNDIMTEYGYQQHVTSSTTENYTLIDHVYSKGLGSMQAEVIPIYYSYHEAIQITF